MPIRSLLLAAVTALALLGWNAGADMVQVPQVRDFQTLSEDAQAKGLPILVEFSLPDCPYCVQLEEEFLKPMLKSGLYAEKVLIRRVNMGDSIPLIDFQGREVSARDFADRYGIRLAPTVILLDAEGRELAERLVGLTTPDFYGGYLDAAIDESLSRMRSAGKV